MLCLSYSYTLYTPELLTHISTICWITYNQKLLLTDFIQNPNDVDAAYRMANNGRCINGNSHNWSDFLDIELCRRRFVSWKYCFPFRWNHRDWPLGQTKAHYFTLDFDFSASAHTAHWLVDQSQSIYYYLFFFMSMRTYGHYSYFRLYLFFFLLFFYSVFWWRFRAVSFVAIKTKNNIHIYAYAEYY